MKKVSISDKAYNAIKEVSDKSGESIKDLVEVSIFLFLLACASEDKDINAKEKEEN